VALRADNPNRHIRVLQVSANSKVPISLKKGQKPNIRLLVDPFDHVVVSHIPIPIKDIAGSFPHQYYVEELLGGIAMLSEEASVSDVHVTYDILEALGQDNRVHQQNGSMAFVLCVVTNVLLHNVVDLF